MATKQKKDIKGNIMIKNIFLGVLFLSTALIASEPQVVRELNVRPTIKFGKIENGNGFMELQYLSWDWYFDKRISLEGSISTGFTAPRDALTRYNHNNNRLEVRVTYRPRANLGFFLEGGFTDRIIGSNNDVSYFKMNNYQAVGISLDIRKYTFK